MKFERIEKKISLILEGIDRLFKTYEDTLEANKIIIILYKKAFEGFIENLYEEVNIEKIKKFLDEVFSIDGYIFEYIECLMTYSDEPKKLNEILWSALVALGKYLEELIDSEKLEEDIEEWETTGESFTMEDFEDDED